MSGRPRQPVQVIGGIDPTHVYSIREFREITGMTRQAMSRASKREKAPLIIRDSDPAMIVGQEYVDYVKASPPRVPRQRRTPNVAK